MCDETREPVFFLYRELELDSSTGLSVEALLKSKAIRSYDNSVLGNGPETYSSNFENY